MDIDLDDKEFGLFQRLIYDESGISLSSSKKELLKSRLMKRLRQKSLPSFRAYYQYVTEEDRTGEEMVRMLDCISTNLTEFFREIAHFEFLSKTVLPHLVDVKKKRNEKKIRIWSAGCSTGEEPYTLSMVVAEHIKLVREWDIKILATDISTRVLAKASEGIYSRERLKNVPVQMLNTYFERAAGNLKDLCQVKESLKKLVVFRRFNLMNETYPFKGQFDFIFCRNVMIYFDKQTQNELILKYYKHLAPDGYLFIGHSESLAGTSHKFKYVRPTVYQK